MDIGGAISGREVRCRHSREAGLHGLGTVLETHLKQLQLVCNTDLDLQDTQ